MQTSDRNFYKISYRVNKDKVIVINSGLLTEKKHFLFQCPPDFLVHHASRLIKCVLMCPSPFHYLATQQAAFSFVVGVTTTQAMISGQDNPTC